MRYFFILATLFISRNVMGETIVSLAISDDLVFTYGFPYEQDSPVSVINLYSDIGESGFYINLWNASEDLGLYIERDYTIGYIYQPFDSTTIDISYNLFDFSEAGTSDDDAFVTTLIVSQEITHAWNVAAVWEEYDGRVIDEYGGPHRYVEIGYTFGVAKEIEVTASLAAGRDQSYESNEKYTRFSIKPGWYVNDRLTIWFLGYDAFFPEDEPEVRMVTFLAFDYSI